MGFPRRPRPRPTQRESHSPSTTDVSSSSSSLHASKRLRLASPRALVFNPLHVRIFFINAKFEGEELIRWTVKAEEAGAKVVQRIEDANIVISRTRLWNRLRRYFPERNFESKKLVTLEWLEDSIATLIQQPFNDEYLIRTPTSIAAHPSLGSRVQDLVDESRQATPLDAESPLPSSPELKPIRGDLPPQDPMPPLSTVEERLADLRKDMSLEAGLPKPIADSEKWIVPSVSPPPWKNKRFACERWHPLICINQPLVNELKVIRDAYKLEGDERRQMTYSKGMAALKSYPYPITSRKQAEGILAVGEKIAILCEEFVKTGKIERAEKLKGSKRLEILKEFNKVHGVGSSTARELYDKYGCRTMLDVQKVEHLLPSMGEKSTRYVDEFDIKIPRAEVQEIAAIVDGYLQALIPGAVHTITGGYRRGKAESNDVDIVFSHPDENAEKGALEALLRAMEKDGIVTDILYEAFTDSKRDSSMQHFHTSHMDPLDKAFTIFLPPKTEARPQPIHRRVDLIAAPYKYYWCAVLGWSGSTIFERDLRLHADKVKGMKFDSGGLWHRATSKEILVKSEEEIFEVLGLQYIPPEWRNADS